MTGRRVRGGERERVMVGGGLKRGKGGGLVRAGRRGRINGGKGVRDKSGEKEEGWEQVGKGYGWE